MEKRRLDEEALLERIVEIYKHNYPDFKKTGEPKRILYGQISDILNEEGILSYHDQDWTWQRVHTFFGKHPSINEMAQNPP